MSNRLANEPSLYLRQHGSNPVEWYPWGPEALAAAQAKDKPILLSIGYSACHWCHVMAHESFENPSIAELMNQAFVCVKVDREERPDVDKIYMDAIQLLTGQGGWPLNVFLLPDGRPFTGGTYFPPDERRGTRVTWPKVVMNIEGIWRTQKDMISETAGKITDALGKMSAVKPSGGIPDQFKLKQAVTQLSLKLDRQNGGFGGAPKFPASMTIGFLSALNDQSSQAERDRMINTTLSCMAYGGIFDQLGGGFARYSTDDLWKIPHFEKMLYDNALLLKVYAQAFATYKEPVYEAVVRETVGWLFREMALPEGGFAAALDADTEGKEGLTYCWTPEEIVEILGEDTGVAFCEAYDITSQGNFEHGTSNPHLLSKSFDTRMQFSQAREDLLAVRQQRPQPGKDGKQVVFWNSLMIEALCEAGFIFGEKAWIESAQLAADRIWDKCVFDSDRLYSVLYGDQARFNGYLDDYASFALALLSIASKVDWIQPGLSEQYLQRAETLLRSVESHFADPSAESPAYFFTSDDHEQLIRRTKEITDNALPCGNSMLLHCFAEMTNLTGSWQEQYEKLAPACTPPLQHSPLYVSNSVSAIAAMVGDTVSQIVKAGSDVDIDTVRNALMNRPYKKSYVMQSSEVANGVQIWAKGELQWSGNSVEELEQYLIQD